MESVKKTVEQGYNYVSESLQGRNAEASKEVNKEIAKDSNAGVGTRAQAGVDAVGDRMNQEGHDNKAEVHKQAM